MKTADFSQQPISQKQSLRTLCRFLALRISYRCLLILLTTTGVIFSLMQRTLFAPYGIALFCLLLPSFLNNSSNEDKKKENNDIPLASLYKRYHYSPIVFSSYRIALLFGMALLLVWHKVQNPALLLFGISLPLLYLALFLAMSPLLGNILFFVFHRRLMNGAL